MFNSLCRARGEVVIIELETPFDYTTGRLFVSTVVRSLNHVFLMCRNLGHSRCGLAIFDVVFLHCNDYRLVLCVFERTSCVEMLVVCGESFASSLDVGVCVNFGHCWGPRSPSCTARPCCFPSVG